MLSKLTIYFSYYNQPAALKNQLDIMSNYSEDVRKKISVFIVDDGSQKEPALPIIEQKYLDKLDITLYRIDIDIPWNMPEANNLAFRAIETDYVIRTDIDHFFYEESISKILSLNIDKNTVYKFSRKEDKTMTILKTAPNIYLISKRDYWKTQGYNESFSGNYGDDFEFLSRLKKFVRFHQLDIYHIVNGTYSTRGLDRDITINMEKYEKGNVPQLNFVHKDKYIKQL